MKISFTITLRCNANFMYCIMLMIIVSSVDWWELNCIYLINISDDTKFLVKHRMWGVLAVNR